MIADHFAKPPLRGVATRIVSISNQYAEVRKIIADLIDYNRVASPPCLPAGRLGDLTAKII